MKKYRLKQWYPSLKKTIKIGSVVSKIYNCGGYSYRGSDSEGNVYYVGGGEVESNPDFWELIEEEKQPLFVTDDGVELFDSWEKVFIIDKRTMYKPRETILRHWICFDKANFKVFAHESNADEYIWRNKRVFSYEDMMKAKHSIILTYEDIEKAAKERA